MTFKFFDKDNNIDVEFWSVLEGLNDESLSFLRPQRASKFFPEWFKKVSTATPGEWENDKGTIKRCPVFPEFLTQGYIIPMWCDTQLFYDGNEYKWKTPTEVFKWDWHSPGQFIDWLPQNAQDKWGFTFKALCPWRLRTPKGYSVYQMPLFYHFQDDWTVLPGSVRTDFHFEIHQQTMLPKSAMGKWIHIPRGTPFAWYIPYKRIETKPQYRSEEEMKQARDASWLNIHTKFGGGYKLRQKMEDNKEK